MTEVFASHRPIYITGSDGVKLTSLSGIRLISGLVLSTAWGRELVGVSPGTFLDQPVPASEGWSRDESVVAVEPSIFVEYKGE